ncbi:MAG: Spy/CpxP family protein refolding chaperone [Desulfuromonas sp.]|nr:Spy/CpxP family protein refolding chaperone [Desulfuromonas sp.]
MMKKSMIPLMLLVVLIAGVINVSATENRFNAEMDAVPFGSMARMHHGMVGPGQRFELLTIALDLNESQQVQIRQMVENQRQKMQQCREGMRQDQMRLWLMMSEQPFNETQFRALAEKVADQRIDMMVNRVKSKQQIFSILTPAQQEKAQKIWDLMGQKHRGKGKGKGQKAMAGRS